jgi:hypothetical protein
VLAIVRDGLRRQHRRRAEHFIRELGWREFSISCCSLPRTRRSRRWTPSSRTSPGASMTPTALLRAWQRGRTGIPIVDAGMRELWHTGWMHNRVRMIVASLLTKNLRLPWQQGARWFWDTLVDADLASNTQGWQWSAGSGADAAPYFRIFNPVRQGERFDPKGTYVRRWCPELAAAGQAHPSALGGQAGAAGAARRAARPRLPGAGGGPEAVPRRGPCRRVSLGGNPLGHKQREGDLRTPEGHYVLDWRNPDSCCYRSLHVSYPDAQDRQAALRRGDDPGGLIMVHGQVNGWGWLGWLNQYRDHTHGCIAVRNGPMEVIWRAVDDGTPMIRP